MPAVSLLSHDKKPTHFDRNYNEFLLVSCKLTEKLNVNDALHRFHCCGIVRIIFVWFWITSFISTKCVLCLSFTSKTNLNWNWILALAWQQSVFLVQSIEMAQMDWIRSDEFSNWIIKYFNKMSDDRFGIKVCLTKLRLNLNRNLC